MGMRFHRRISLEGMRFHRKLEPGGYAFSPVKTPRIHRGFVENYRVVCAFSPKKTPS